MVIGEDVLALEVVENGRITDDGIAIRAARVGGFEKAPAGAPGWIIRVHVHLPQDDLFFLFKFVLRERRMLADIAENVDGGARAGIGDIDVIHGAIKRGVGVHVAAGILDLLVNA